MPRRSLLLIAATAGMIAASFLLPRTALAGGTCHKGQPVIDQRATTVAMANNCFVATITRVDEGATVTFVNEDENEHAVTGANFSWGMDDIYEEGPSALLKQGESIQQTFSNSGVYPYFCFVHPGMIGVIVVGDGQGAGASTSAAFAQGSLASSAPQRPAASAAQAAGAGSNDGVSATLMAALIGTGIVALAAVVTLGRALATRRASVR